MKDLGKPGAGDSHARFDEGRLETGSGLGPAEPTMQCVDSAGPPRPPRQSPTLPRGSRGGWGYQRRMSAAARARERRIRS